MSPFRRVDDALRRSRVLWGGACWFHTAILAGFGISYLVFGTQAVAAPHAYEVFIRFVPGRLATYGAIMLALALSMLYGLCAPLYGAPMLQRWVCRVLLVLCGYDILLSWLFVWSWVLSGTVTALAVFTWLCLAGLALLLATCPPATDERDGRDQ